MKSRVCLWVAASAVWLGLGAPVSQARDLSFEDRVEAQEAIERVYWSHRTWPKENPESKPALASVMSDAVIRAKVENYLKESDALAELWERPITAEQLQAEMDRMTAQSQAPDVLREIFKALGDDPGLIAETLARQALSDRLIRNWYAADDRFHGDMMAGASGAKRSFDDWWVAAKSSFPASAPSAPSAGEVFSLPALSLTGCINDTWKSLPVPPTPRDHHVAVWTGTEMIVWGGYYTMTDQPADIYNPSTDTWRQASRVNTPYSTYGTTAVWTGTEMIVWGAQGFVGARYNPTTDVWVATRVDANTPTGRLHHTAVWSGTEMIVWGGDNGGSSYLADGGRYKPSTDSWIYISPYIITARSGHSAAWTGTEMIVWGGYNGSTYLNDGGRFHIGLSGNGDWSFPPIGDATLAGRAGHTAVWTGTRMIVWGGYNDSGALDSGSRYSPTTNTWLATSTASGAPAARYSHTAVWTGSRMIVWGGNDGVAQTNSGGRYDPVADTWSPTSIGTNVPNRRHYHTAVWSGSEMIVFGGYSYFEITMNSGGRYDPSSNTWIPTSTLAAYPYGPYDGSSLWTGTEVIVWGSSAGEPEGGVGARYEPSTNTWTRLSTSGQPSLRSWHTAVWSGREMIVWGGQYGGNGLSSGGRYDPASDTWTPTSLVNAPAGRYQHIGLWTGTEMIVWGGLPAYAEGGRYRPSTDSWVPTSTGAHAPVFGNGYSAVWTGSEMIAWEGYYTGGRYSPSTDTWSEPSSIGAPANRRGSLVWTGSDMIVWGGQDANFADTNTGGRYNASTDTWTPTSTGTNVPSPRSSPSAVWTGDEMLIWGGSGNSALRSGGRYRSSTDSWTPIAATADAPYGSGPSIWTGKQMLLWVAGAGFSYCACPNGRLVYRDADGDGYGVAGVPTSSCDGSIPAGYVANDDDCADVNGAVHPGAAEVCNGLDDDCDGIVDDGGSSLCSDADPCTIDACAGGACTFTPVVVPEVSASLAVTKSGPSAVISWADAPGPFNVYRGMRTAPAWAYNASCLDNGTSGPTLDAALPDPEVAAWYLVSRTSACGESVLGLDSGGAPIPNVSPCP